jgi:hypothetical protein
VIALPSRSHVRRGLLLASLLVVACGAPADVTPLLPVNQHAAARALLLMGGGGGPSADAAPTARSARVHVMKDGEQLGGPNAVGRPGDLVLENDEVVFVVDQLGSSAGFAESGGNLVDAADAHGRKDELGQVFSYFGTFPRQGVYESLKSGTDKDGAAWVEARGHELYESKLAVVTRYVLHPPDRALLVTTTLENTGDSLVTLPSVGDAVQWGGAEKFAPGKERGFKGPSNGAFVGAVGRFASYAITSTEGKVEAVSGGGWTDTMQRKDVPVDAHGKADYARVFVVGARPDTSSVVAELSMSAGEPTGELELTGLDGPVRQLGAFVELRPQGATEGLTLAPPYVATLPVGRYTISPGGATADLAAGGGARVEVRAPSIETLTVGCVGPGGAAMPCKVTVQGIHGTHDPAFGPAHAAGPARRQVTTSGPPLAFVLAWGDYRLTASRGPEYPLATADVAPGDHQQTFALARVVDTTGYVGCDFHQHTMLGADAPTGTRDRVIANVAEGVEVAVASEHNVVADFAPLVRELHLEKELVSIAGDELTTDASRHPWGHANVFPMVADPGKPRGGAPPVRDRLARDVFEDLRRSLKTDFVLQVNHPRTGLTGYFDQLAFDRATGVGTEAGYDPGFDALEVWNGRNVDARDKVLEDFYALLRTSHVVTATADTDTHGVVGQEAGYPRTYVRVDDDAHLDAWDAARTADIVRGVKVRRDVVLTNGPFLRVTANGAPVGGMARGKNVDVRVDVAAAPWVVVDTVRVVRARHADTAVTRKLEPTLGKDGALHGAAVIPVAFDADDAIVVIVSGSAPMTPVLTGADKEIAPWAMTGAIWIDTDGDGRSLGLAR